MSREPTGRRSILITGATSGFGLLTARLALARGWRVAATARRPETLGLEPSQDLLRLRLDVTDQESVREAVRAALAALGALDAVVNNAGMAVYGMSEEVPEEALRRQLDTNFFGAVAVTRAVLPHMRERRTGQLVFVSSDWGRTGIPGYSSYCASKFALEGWVESLFHEVSGFGLGVTLVEPGAFDTGFAAEIADAARDPASPYAALHRSVGEGFDGEGRAPTGEPVAESIMRAASGEEPRLRVPVGEDAMNWSTARFIGGEEEFVRALAARYGWRTSRQGME
jgi:NAD(P)-dependent dehydrogenase (short-subunit alcohol dehydrogenase family)